MEIGLVGLGKMGYNMALNFADKGVHVVAFNRTKEKTDKLIAENSSITPAYSLEELIKNLSKPRIVWLMISAGSAVDDMISKLSNILDKGDIIIDGGNSFYKDSIRHYEELNKNGINFLDIGTSGGLSGARNGACFMVGGDKEVYNTVEPLLKLSSVEGGYGYMGPAGSGHFVKMVHNGIEYGIMQSIGEGFQLLKEYDNFDFREVSKVWSHGSIISGHLMTLVNKMFSQDPKLDNIEDKIGQSGEGLWTLQTALEYKVPLPSITSAIFKRFESHKPMLFSTKVIQGMRKMFGGHDAKNRI